MMENLAKDGLEANSIIHDYKNNLEFYLDKSM